MDRCTVFITVVFGILALGGCQKLASAVDDAPFRNAIGDYVQGNNMAMKINEIKQGPVIDGDTARLTASMTHEQLGGPSVTWEFQFVKQPDGSWRATSHKN